MTSSWCHQMCMNGRVNQGSLFDISVWCKRSLKTKLHPMIVRQYSRLKLLLGTYTDEVELQIKQNVNSLYNLFLPRAVHAKWLISVQRRCLQLYMYSFHATLDLCIHKNCTWSKRVLKVGDVMCPYALHCKETNPLRGLRLCYKH